jgi:AbrB family looped-hinge helix DNA binding protein
VEIAATVTSEGQITLPKQVRDALGVREGDRVVFRVLAGRAVVARAIITFPGVTADDELLLDTARTRHYQIAGCKRHGCDSAALDSIKIDDMGAR